ncbi:hypothetical protein L6D11_13905 [Staphylococcus aureus]|nr:hypothetical protein [Staphylococcus aureus]
MNKKKKVNVNHIKTEGFSAFDKQRIDIEIKRLNSIDSLFTLVMILMLSIIFVSKYIHMEYANIITSLLMIAAIIYIRIARISVKHQIEQLLKKQESYRNVTVYNTHEKMHTVAMYLFLFVSFMTLVNTLLSMFFV